MAKLWTGHQLWTGVPIRPIDIRRLVLGNQLICILNDRAEWVIAGSWLVPFRGNASPAFAQRSSSLIASSLITLRRICYRCLRRIRPSCAVDSSIIITIIMIKSFIIIILFPWFVSLTNISYQFNFKNQFKCQKIKFRLVARIHSIKMIKFNKFNQVQTCRYNQLLNYSIQILNVYSQSSPDMSL